MEKKLKKKYTQRKVPGTDKEIDRALPALPPGWRISAKTGKPYFEDRENRSDTEKERRYYKGTGRRATPGKKTAKQSTRTTRSTTTSRRVSQVGKRDPQKGHRMLKCKPRRPVIKTRKSLINRGNRGPLTKPLKGHWFTHRYEFKLMESTDKGYEGQYFLWMRDLPYVYRGGIIRGVLQIQKEPKWVIVATESFGTSLTKAEERVEKVVKEYLRHDTDGMFDMTQGLYDMIQKAYSGKQLPTVTTKELDKLNSRVKEWERKIHSLKDHEEALSFGYDGTLLWHAIGKEQSVNQPHFAWLVTAIFTHNHPSSRYYAPSPLSAGDLEAFAAHKRHHFLKELRACGHGYVCRINYRMTSEDKHYLLSCERDMQRACAKYPSGKVWYEHALPISRTQYNTAPNAKKYYSEERL